MNLDNNNHLISILLKGKLVLISLILFNSCKSLNLTQPKHTSTIQQISLGSIGSEKEFNNSAIPNYKAPIKLSVTTKPFNKQTYKSFTEAKEVQSSKINITYIDSLPNKPKYLQLQIADKVAVVHAFNSVENKAVKAYLSLNTAQVLSGISIAFNQKNIEGINHADAVFLVENGLKTYALQLYKNKVKTETISFNDSVVFEYQVSNCCWQENKKHQMDIVDIVSRHTNCPKNTSQSSKQAKKKITNYYKL